MNLQVADTVINFELPWNPAKKNQRIGRIDRLGQTAKQLTVLNFITRGSIEEKILTGLALKQNLFDGVLDTDSTTDEVDFSKSGRAQFMEKLEETISEFENPISVEEELVEEEKEVTAEPEQVSDEIIEPDSAIEEPLKPKPDSERVPKPGAQRNQNNHSPKPKSEPEIELKPQSQASNDASSSEGGKVSPSGVGGASETQITERTQRLEEMETVMNQGMQFLAGMYKMSTGKEMTSGQQKIEIDKETGEVVMRFKLNI